MRTKLLAFVLLGLLGCNGTTTSNKESNQRDENETGSNVGLAPSQWVVENSSNTVSSSLLHSLPAAPHKTLIDPACETLVINPKSIAGEQIQDLGWHVTHEITHGPITVVSFFSSSESGLYGSCHLNDSNIGIFTGKEILADVYKKKNNEDVGSIEALHNGSIRIFSSEYPSPLADLHLQEHSKRIIINSLPRFESFCRNQLRVPNVYGVSVIAARKRLLSSGWAPVIDEDATFETAPFRDSGLTEYRACTPYLLCSLAYQYQGATLHVSAIGEEEQIIYNYEVECNDAIDFNPPSSVTTASSSPHAITMSEYQRISTGMSYREVTEIIGQPGVEISRASNVINYQWSDEPPSGMILAAFMDDKLASKGQVGLR